MTTLLLYALGALLLFALSIGLIVLSVKLALRLSGTREDRTSEPADNSKKRGKR
jgi:hypothetical protein